MTNILLGGPYSTIHYGDILVVTDRQGWIGQGQTGIYSRDTRYLSSYRLNINGISPVFLGMTQPYYFAASFYYTNQPIASGTRLIPENALLLNVSRYISLGVHEDIQLTNYAGVEIEVSLTLNIGADFADIFQVRNLAGLIPRIATVAWDEKKQRLVFSYRNGDFTRSIFLRLGNSTSPAIRSVNTMIFRLRLQQGQTWRTCVDIHFDEDASTSHVESDQLPAVARELDQWRATTARVETPAREVEAAYYQSISDLGSLRLERLDGAWFPAAGLPWFMAVFGRDSLIIALQTTTVYSPFAVGVLDRLAPLQGRKVDNWTEEEPGKIPHELRKGELSATGKIPYTPYYGTVDASLLFIILLHEVYRFTGDRGLLERFYEAALACLEWASRYGDFDGDGFVEYRPLSPKGYKNQGWKDSGEAVVYPDGSNVSPPIALCEVQGYYFDSLLRMAEVARLTGREENAGVYLKRAQALYSSFNEVFWMEDEGTYAFGLDARKLPIATVASNAGHLFWSGIVPPERASRLAGRLMADDMFSGWGVRTLSSGNPAFDPVSYQRGSVWPHDNAIIALGLKRYGFWQEANRIAEGIFNAAACYERTSLPEVFAGIARTPLTAPVPYAEANIPQGWAAGCIFMLLRAILGLEPDPEGERLLVTPTLPDWLPEITYRNLTFLGGKLDLHFRGSGPGSSVQVIHREGTAKVEQQKLNSPPVRYIEWP